MTRDKKLLLQLGLLMAFGLFVVECRHHQHDETAVMTTEPRHRHRHRHESSNRRNHHELNRRSWPKDDYEYDGDSEDSMDEDDYEVQSYYDHPRSYHRSVQKNYHDRMFESRYPPRYHGGYRGNWYHEDNDRRRIPSRYNKNWYKSKRTYYRPTYSRNRDFTDFEDDSEEDFDYERPHRRIENDKTDKLHEWWRNSMRHSSLKKDTKNKMNSYRSGRKHHLEDRGGVIDRADMSRWSNDRKIKSNISESKYPFAKDDKKIEEDEDYEDHGGLEDDDKDEEEDDIWKNIDDEDNEDNEEEELDNNDFYESKTKLPLKTFDDIIRRLTSDEPTTEKATVRRDYRNIESNKHMKRDGYKNFNEPRNVSRPVDVARFNASRNVSTMSIVESSTVKSLGAAGHKLSKNATNVVVKDNNRQGRNIAINTKTKSLEQDYDEYSNAPNNEKEDEAGAEEDSTMQADVTNNNQDYTDDDNGDEDETPVDTLATTTTTTTTTSTTPRTTTPKPSINRHYDYRDQRTYRNTGAQYNGYQTKNDYPPMSDHSKYKWQSLGTREGVQETRSNMQQYNKNSVEHREAVRHMLQVNTEGSCQWPRARLISVRDVYPNPSITYFPHCAILHRCSDDTGCCKSEALTCVPKHSHRVELFFYNSNTVTGDNGVEKLSFYNHTECECKARSEYDTTNLNKKPEPEHETDQRVYRHSSPPQNMKRPPSRKTCRCPSEFTPRITSKGTCQCNCFESNQNCIKTRRGKAYFSLADRICIQNNECAMPNCEFGEYIKQSGKCPGKKDTFNNAMANFRSNQNHRFRS